MRGGPGVRAPAPHYLEGSQVIILNCICAFICFLITLAVKKAMQFFWLLKS